MEDVVAVEVLLQGGQRRYFVTWGRVHDTTDPAPLEALVLDKCVRFSLDGTPVSARVCDSLQEARGQPYFYESLVDFAAGCAAMRASDDYEGWRAQTESEMNEGRHLYYLGLPRPPSSAGPLADPV